jgi:hypothetical protein
MWGTPGLQATQCGYLRPEKFAGNHSLLWMDVSYHSALGHNPPRPRTLEARRLQLYDKRCVQQYLWKYEKSIIALQLQQRQFKLESQTKMGVELTPAQQQEIEAIDFLKTRCMKEAEKGCRKLHTGEIAFSEATIMPIQQIRWWTIAIKRRLGGKVQLSQWKRRRNKAGLEGVQTSHLSIQEMVKKRSKAQTEYRKV